MITLKMIKETTEQVFELEAESLENPSRVPAIVDGRHAYWLAALYFGFKPTYVGEEIDRHHATGYNSVTRCLYLCQAEAGYKRRINELFNNLKPYEKTEKVRYGITLFRCAVDAII